MRGDLVWGAWVAVGGGPGRRCSPPCDTHVVHAHCTTWTVLPTGPTLHTGAKPRLLEPQDDILTLIKNLALDALGDAFPILRPVLGIA